MSLKRFPRRIPIRISHSRHFCEALFEVEEDYKFNNFRHAIICADGIDDIQRKMGTVKHINMNKGKIVHSSIYSAAIQRAQELGEYSECWRLYNEAKHESKIDIHLLTQMINITAKFVENQYLFDYDGKNSKMYNKSKLEVAKHKMLCRVHRLYNEMRNEFHLTPTQITFASLISACSKFKSFVGAQRYFDIYCNEEQFKKERNIEVYSAIIAAKINKADIDGAMALFDEMTNVYKIKANQYILSKILSGFAHCIAMKHKKEKFKNYKISEIVSKSEGLVKGHLSSGNAMEIEIFNGLCNVYASNGDILSCFDILHCLMNKQLPKNWNVDGVPPLPNIYTFNTCLKALVYAQDLHQNEKQKQNVWRLVDFVLDKMKEYDIKRDCSTYSSLFNLCGNSMNEQIKPDLDKAIAFYLELANSATVISKKCMYSLLMTGLQFYDHSGSKDDARTKHDFIEWWLSEAKDYKVQCHLSVQQLLDIKAKKFRIPK